MMAVEPRVAENTVRVSVRELAEVTRWAFIAAGCSAGEAAVAGRIVQLAEVRFGCGVDAALNELRNHRFSPQPIRRLPGSVETIDDQHGRGLLTIGPLAAALATSRGPSGGVVIIRNMTWHPVIAAVLLQTLQSSCSSVRSLAAWPLSAKLPSRGVIADADSLRTTPFDPASMQPSIDLILADAAQQGGVAFAPAGPSFGSTQPNPSDDANPEGVHVDSSDWASLYEAAQRFLVIDS